MREVIFLLKLVEGIFSCVCMTIHIIGFLYKEEPLQHVMIFCGTYFGYMLISIAGIIAIIAGIPISIILEAIVAKIGFLLFLSTSILSMYYVENDYHLSYLTDTEEFYHRFFYMSRIQSIAALATSLILLMHFVLVADIYWIKERTSNIDFSRRRESLLLNERDKEATQPLQLNLFWIKIDCLRERD